MFNSEPIYLTETQAKDLLSWNAEYSGDEEWISWGVRQEENTERIRKMIERSDFLKSTNLAESQLDELFRLFYKEVGNRQMRHDLYKENGLGKFNRVLRLLLAEKEPLPKRFDEFIGLKKIGMWTASQFLAEWDPCRYPLIAADGRKGFMAEVLINNLGDSQLELARRTALESYEIDENEYQTATIKYLTLLVIFNEVRDICGFDSYLKVQNLLWRAHCEKRKVTMPDKNGRGFPRKPKADPIDDKYGKDDSSRTASPERVARHTLVWKRNQKYIDDLKKKYSGKCQFTGCPIGTFMKKDGTPYSEAHHPKPLGENGADDPGNIVILCPTHHKMFHYADAEIKKIGDMKATVDINGELANLEFLQSHFVSFWELFKRKKEHSNPKVGSVKIW